MYTFIFIRDKHNFLRNVNAEDISLIEADGRYTKVITINAIYILNDSLTQLEADLPALFCRVHRTYIVSIPRIVYIDGNLIHLENKDIPLSKQYRKNLFERIKVLK